MKYFIVFCLLIFGLKGYSQQPTPKQIKMVEDARKEVKRMKGEKFPAFELTTIEGTTYNSEDLLGKIVVFNFWFTRCRPCVEELPEINALRKEFEREDIVFIAPTFEDLPKVEKFLARFNMEYEVVADVKDFATENKIYSYPTHFVLDRKGYIEKVVIGYSVITSKMLRKAINKLLK